MRFRSLLYDLYNEFWLNEAIINLFPNKKKYIDDLSFNGKLRLLDSHKIFDKSPKLFENLKYFNQVRNRYAHVLLRENELDDHITVRIGKMVSLFGNDKIYLDKEPIEKFNILGFEIFRFLVSLFRFQN